MEKLSECHPFANRKSTANRKKRSLLSVTSPAALDTQHTLLLALERGAGGEAEWQTCADSAAIGSGTPLAVPGTPPPFLGRLPSLSGPPISDPEHA